MGLDTEGGTKTEMMRGRLEREECVRMKAFKRRGRNGCVEPEVQR